MSIGGRSETPERTMRPAQIVLLTPPFGDLLRVALITGQPTRDECQFKSLKSFRPLVDELQDLC